MTIRRKSVHVSAENDHATLISMSSLFPNVEDLRAMLHKQLLRSIHAYMEAATSSNRMPVAEYLVWTDHCFRAMQHLVRALHIVDQGILLDGELR